MEPYTKRIPKFKSLDELKKGEEELEPFPEDQSTIDLLVIRPGNGLREEPAELILDKTKGVIGDNWSVRGSSKTEDGTSHPKMQITLMNSSIIQLISGEKSYWNLAGDQIYTDLDLSQRNLQVGTKIKIGNGEEEVILEVSPIPHTGCKKFLDRYGKDALRFVGSDEGMIRRRRGVNAFVVKPGTIKLGDSVYKMK